AGADVVAETLPEVGVVDVPEPGFADDEQLPASTATGNTTAPTRTGLNLNPMLFPPVVGPPVRPARPRHSGAHLDCAPLSHTTRVNETRLDALATITNKGRCTRVLQYVVAG